MDFKSVKIERRWGARFEFVGVGHLICACASWRNKAVRLVVLGVSFHAGRIPYETDVTKGKVANGEELDKAVGHPVSITMVQEKIR